jgi:hypothetical protein
VEWKGYRACCRTHALDHSARVCPECGQPLLRCRSFDRCGALLAPADACPVHVAPRLSLKKGAVLKASVGERVALPLVFSNGSAAGAALRLRKFYKIEPDREPEDLLLYWDTVQPGEERGFSVETGILSVGGSIRVSLVGVFSTAFGEVEEDFAFAADVLLHVEQGRSQQIVQNIHVEGGTFAAGASAVVQTGPSIHEGLAAGRDLEPESLLPLQRAEAFELRQGIRGYRDEGVRLHRSVEVSFEGFREGDAPPAGLHFLAQDRLACGRNSRKKHEKNPSPNDVTLRVYSGGDGPADPERSARISGRHLDLVLRNDRLYLLSLGRGGTWLNGRTIDPGAEAVLHPGDRIRPLVSPGPGIEVVVSWRSRDGAVDRITLTGRSC